MQNVLRNLRFSFRMLRKSLGLTAAIAITLALGVGATTAIYTVVYATLIAPMPYPKPDQLVIVWSWVKNDRNGVAAGDYTDWVRLSKAFQGLKAMSGTSFNLAGKEAPEMVSGEFGTPGWYSMWGVPFQLGRDILPEEGVAGKDRVVTIANRLWKRLGADPHMIGKTIMLDQKPYTVVGVWAPGQPDRLPWELVVPLVFTPDQLNHDFHWLNVMGRLKDGVSLKQANADMTAVAAQVARDNPKSDQGWSARVEPLHNDYLGDDVKVTLWLFLGAVGFLLIIACVNVANLLLAKSTTRQREVAIRSAIGASRRNIFAQFITESLMLAFIGGALGVGLGYAMLRGFIAIMPKNTLPSEADLSLNLPILLVTLAATTLAGLLFGCAPAWYAAHVDPAESLKEGGRTSSGGLRHRLRQLLVVGEFTLALALLTGAGLAMHSFWNLTHVDLGVQTDHVLTFDLPMLKGMDWNSDQIIGHYRDILRSIQSTTGVESAAAVTGMPLEGTGFGMPFTIAGRPGFTDPSQRPVAGFQMITQDYFRTFGIRVVKGRAITDEDSAGSPNVAMVNEEFVRRFFPGQDPIGQRLMVEQLIPGVQKLGPAQPWQIVGVFHDVRGGSFDRPHAEIDVPFFQLPWTTAGFGVRTAGDPAAMTRTIAAAVNSVDATAALDNLETMDQIRDDDVSPNRFTMLLFACFAVIALALAAVGIYGVMAFVVGQRGHEIGIRMALGASRQSVVQLILLEGLTLAGVGLVFGFGGAYLVGRAMQSTLYGVGSLDLLAFSAVAAVLLCAALVACYLPARRAAAVEPMQALRTE
ncbi:MAG TPA: ABC transporter permease [Terracidiphilus sp.]|jgi:putative ABC transport system permease protein